MTLTEAIEQYGHSRQWWYTQVKAGLLHLYRVPGDRNSYVSREEVAAALEPRPKPQPEERSGNKEAM